MKKDEVIKRVLALMTMDSLKKSVEKLLLVKPDNDGLNLFKAALAAKDDEKHLWFTSFAVLCALKPKLAGKLIEEAVVLSGHPPIFNLNKAELIDAIASGSKLTKADAGRIGIFGGIFGKLTKADAGRALDAAIESIHITVK